MANTRREPRSRSKRLRLPLSARRAVPDLEAASPVEAITSELPEIFRALVRVAIDAGVRPKAVHQAMAQASKSPHHDENGASRRREALAASVIAHWHTNFEYLDDLGRPRSLPVSGRDPSVQGLLDRVVPRREQQAVTKLLLESPSIVTGVDRTWSLVGPNMIRVKGRAAAQRVTGMVEALLRTEFRNIGALPVASGTMFSVHALVTDIPDAAARQLRARAARVLRPPVEDLSEWLEKSHSKSGRRSMGQSGVIAIAYQLPLRKARSPKRSRPAAAKTRSSI